MNNVLSAGGGGSLARMGPGAVLELLRDGATVVDVAKLCGVSDASVYGYLLRHVPEEWKALSVGRALARLEEAQADLDEAVRTPEPVDVNRAQAKLKAAQWYLERLCARHFGEAAKVPGGGVVVNVLVNREGVVSVGGAGEMGALSGEFSAVSTGG